MAALSYLMLGMECFLSLRAAISCQTCCREHRSGFTALLQYEGTHVFRSFLRKEEDEHLPVISSTYISAGGAPNSEPGNEVPL